MQKHQEWLNNRIYQQHLHCLTKIKQNSRKNQIKSATHFRRRKVSHHQDSPNHTQTEEQNGNNCSGGKVHKQMKFTPKEKQLIWNNFLLGKRIIETNPVINAKKQQDQYQKYKKILDRRIERNKKQATNTNFRNNKLKQFTLNTFRLSNTHRIQTTARSRFILCLKIVNIQIYRPCHGLEDIRVKMRTEGKKSVQSSEIVNVMSLPCYEFVFKYFTIKDSQSATHSLLIDIYEVKGLEERHMGGFSIDRQNISDQTVCLLSEMCKNEKEIGRISYQIHILSRRKLKQTS